MPAVHTDLLKARRDELDLGNPELATLVKITPAYLVNVLCGADNPSMRLIHRLARVLNLPWRDIVVDAASVPESDQVDDTDDENEHAPCPSAVAS